MVELDQVPGRVADVELRLTAGQLGHRVAERRVENPQRARPLVDRHDVVHLEGEMGVRRRLVGPLEEVHLEVPRPEPLDGEPEVGRRDRLQAEHVDVEANRLVEVARDDAHMVQPDGAAHLQSGRDVSGEVHGRQRLAGGAREESVPTHRFAGWKTFSARRRPASGRPTRPPASRSSAARSCDATTFP